MSGMAAGPLEPAASVITLAEASRILAEQPFLRWWQLSGVDLGPASSDITCTARVLRLGRRFAFVVAETVDAAGRLVAHSSLIFARQSRTPLPVRRRQPARAIRNLTRRGRHRRSR